MCPYLSCLRLMGFPFAMLQESDRLCHCHQPDVWYGLPVQHICPLTGDRALTEEQACSAGQRCLSVQLLVLRPALGPHQLPVALPAHAGTRQYTRHCTPNILNTSPYFCTKLHANSWSVCTANTQQEGVFRRRFM